MHEEYLDQLRKYFGKTSQESIDNKTLLDMGRVAGGSRALEPYLGTPFFGCSSEDLFPNLVSLVRSLMVLGCLPLMDQGEKLTRDETPGSLWITFYCKPEKEETLKLMLSKVKGFELNNVFAGLYVLICQQAAQAIPLSEVILQQIGVTPSDQERGKEVTSYMAFPQPGDEIDVLFVGEVQFRIRSFSVTTFPSQEFALIDCTSDEGHLVMITFTRQGSPLPRNDTVQLYPETPWRQLFLGTISASSEQYPMYIDLLRNETVWAFLSFESPESNKMGTEPTRAGWGHLE